MPLEKAPKNIPNEPGVYFFKDTDDNTLYIGKAKDLKKRVSSYFQNSKQQTIRTKKMLSKAEKLDYTTVKSELEAVILEANLIREHRPKYNVAMKDDKNFVYIRISTHEDFPRIQLVRQLKKDKAKYLGPKTAAHKVKKTLKILKKIFPYRHCGLDIDFLEEGTEKHKVKVTNKVLKYPCIDFFIKRCPAPCVGKVTPAEYKKIMDQVVRFLEGNTDPLLSQLETQMKEAATNKQFEKAGQIRDKLLVIKEIIAKQVISGTSHEFIDILGVALEDKKAFVTLFQIRDGKLIDQENFMLDNENEYESEVLEAFIRDYYQATNDFPKEIISLYELSNKNILETWLAKLSEKKVKILTVQKGKKKELVNLASKNAESFLNQQKTRWEEKEAPGLIELKKILKLKKEPARIEGYDISHLGGRDTVGSMVVFKNGLPSKEDYRHFRIKTLKDGDIDDFASLKEVFSRRLLRIKQQVLLEKNKKDFKIRKLIKKYHAQLDKEPAEDEAYYIILRKEKVIGHIILKKHEEELWQISYIEIDKKYQDRELEHLLIKKAIKECPYRKLYLVIAKENLADYQKRRWKESKAPPKQIELKEGEIPLFHERKKVTADSFTEVPDLILVDGGKGQLSQLTKVLKEYDLKIPAISLAKREEEVFVSESKTPIILPKTNLALKLLQRIRNEAHRFAIEHQRKSRKSKINITVLDEIEGIGPKTRNELLKKFKTIENIAAAKDEELLEVVNKDILELLHTKLSNR